MAIRTKERNTYQHKQVVSGDEKIVVDGINFITPDDIANRAPQADMDETNPLSPAYVKNKPSVYTQTEIQQLIAGFITKSVNDLANYYLKTDTYTKTEVQQLLSALKQFSYESVAVLPAASAQTMHKIYLVPSGASESQNTKDEYITILESASYAWEKIGSTAIDLSGYVTTTYLTSALAGYTTTSALNALLEDKADKSTTFTKTEINSLISGFITKSVNDLVNYYSKTEINGLISDFITNSVNDLTNYYLKGETYTKSEVQQLFSALKQFSYESVAVLPTASSQTMHKIFLVPSGTSESQNTKDEYITILESGSYAWEKIGSTAIDLSGYVTSTALNAALLGKQNVINAEHKLSASLIDGLPAVPNIAESIGPSSTNQDAAGAQAVYGALHPAFVATIPASGAESNKTYRLGTVTGAVVIALASPEDDDVDNFWHFTFTTDSAISSISWPVSVNGWVGNCLDDSTHLPKIVAGKHYEVDIDIEGYAYITEF